MTNNSREYMKHAFLILAHNEPKILQTLITLLDNKNHDIYVHIDKKNTLPNIQTTYSHIYFLTQRIDVRWGDISIIEAELLLYKTANNNGPYLYYHLLSGVDLPLKSNIYIDDFFLKNKGKEFVGFSPLNEDFIWRVNRYHFFTRHYNIKGMKGFFFKSIRRITETLINTIKRRHHKLYFRKGSNWSSITQEFCDYIILKENEILKTFRYTLAPDEFFLQTYLWNSPYKKNIFNLYDENTSCMREIDWERGTDTGHPYTWGQCPQDINILINSKKIFARKFSSKYMNIITELSTRLKQLQ